MTGSRPEPESPIELYLDELVAGMSTRRPRQLRDLLAEAEAHLRDDAEQGVAAGLSSHAAELAAVARFGSVRDLVSAEQQRVTTPPAMLARQFALTTVLLGSIGALAVGISGLLAGLVELLAGSRVLAGPSPGQALPATACARWLSLDPTAGTCRAAATADWVTEVIGYRLVVGVLGGLTLASYLLVRRRWLRPYRWRLLPEAVMDTIALTCFGVAGVWTLGMGVDSVVVAAGDGSGQWFTAAPVALVAAAAFGFRLLRVLGTSPGPDVEVLPG